MILTDAAFLAAPGFRSRAYAQSMVQADLLPALVLELPGEEPVWEGPGEVRVDLGGPGGEMIFRPDEPTRITLAAAGVPIDDIPTADINTPQVAAIIAGIEADVVIYSGLGGVLLKPPLLNCDKRFLHVHGGYAPAYRGSTAFYYSLLAEGSIGATALWLEPGIDAGPIILRRNIRPPRGIEIDRVLDPLARARVLTEVLATRGRTGSFPEGTRDSAGAETYHVIHPVLKHLALRRCGLVRSQ